MNICLLKRLFSLTLPLLFLSCAYKRPQPSSQRNLSSKVKLSELEKKVEFLSHKNFILESQLGELLKIQKTSVTSADSPQRFQVPLLNEKKLYTLLRKSFLESRWEKTIVVARLFLKYYPESIFSGNTLYVLARSEFEKGNFQESLKNVNHYLEKYPLEPKYTEILLLKSQIYGKLNLREAERSVLESLIKKYPMSHAAQLAYLKLKGQAE